MSDKGRESTQECDAQVVAQAVADVLVTFKPMQLRTEIRIISEHGAYRLTPLPTITAYQSLRITMLMLAVAASHGESLDDAWEATHGETAEHWTRIED